MSLTTAVRTNLTLHLLGTAHTGHCWDAGPGEGKVHVVGPDLRSSALLSFSAPSSHPDFKDPPVILQGPKLPASYPSLPL